MADRIDVDPGALQDLGVELTAIGKEFTNANNHSNAVADAVGHDHLADAVRNFAHAWDDTRKGMVGDIDSLGKFATQIGDSLAKLDQQLADGVKGK